MKIVKGIYADAKIFTDDMPDIHSGEIAPNRLQFICKDRLEQKFAEKIII